MPESLRTATARARACMQHQDQCACSQDAPEIQASRRGRQARERHPLAPPALVPSSPNPPINKGIESAIDHSIKQEFFNTISSKLPFAAPSVNICSGRKTSKQVRCVPNHVHPKLRQHSVSNTAIANTVFNTVIQRLKYSATRQKVCLWCVFEKHNLSVYAAYLSH